MSDRLNRYRMLDAVACVVALLAVTCAFAAQAGLIMYRVAVAGEFKGRAIAFSFGAAMFLGCVFFAHFFIAAFIDFLHGPRLKSPRRRMVAPLLAITVGLLAAGLAVLVRPETVFLVSWGVGLAGVALLFVVRIALFLIDRIVVVWRAMRK